MDWKTLDKHGNILRVKIIEWL